jgi:hypothetical protein
MAGIVSNRKVTESGCEGIVSKWLNVLSGVPQGSILGPLLFLIFVNEIPRWIVNDMKMFADDTKLWTRISSPEDSESLQLDLDSLAAWSNEWQLYFNPEKCKVMHIGHPYDTKYYMHEEGTRVEVQSVVEEKELGVTSLETSNRQSNVSNQWQEPEQY